MGFLDMAITPMHRLKPQYRRVVEDKQPQVVLFINMPSTALRDFIRDHVKLHHETHLRKGGIHTLIYLYDANEVISFYLEFEDSFRLTEVRG